MFFTVIIMLDKWNNAVISQVNLAVYVEPGGGTPFHKNRAFHGFVTDDGNGIKQYKFSNGKILQTKKGYVYYLPKGSTYSVESLNTPTGCWAINFLLEEDVWEEPFCVSFKNIESVLGNFKEAVNAFKVNDENSNLIVRRNIYDIILKIRKESKKHYVPNSKLKLLEPALEKINIGFTENDLSVKVLAELCNMSENYFRRLFNEQFGISPKEYVIRRKIDYAKKLLGSGQFAVFEAAQMCGYFEPCHFSREFTKRVGVSPSKYKEAYLE